MLIGLICCAVLVLVTCGFLYCNRAGKLHAMQKEQKQKQEQLNDSQKIADRLPEARRELLDAQAQLSILEQGVSSKVYVPTFLRQIEELGKKNNLRVIGIRPKPVEAKPQPVAVASDTGKDSKDAKKAQAKPAPPDPYDKLEIDLEITGKYWDAVRFMHDITSFPKIVAVNDIQMQPVGQTSRSASPALSLRFNATAFILKQPGTDGKSAKTDKVIAEARDGDEG